MNKDVFWNINSLPLEHNAKPNLKLEYYSMDQPSKWNRFAKRDYATEQIAYNFNKQGYRSENNYDDDYDYGFLIAGDSFVIGEGLPIEDTWAYLLTKKLENLTTAKLPHLALGWPGASSKRITNNIMAFVNNYKTDRILAMFPIVDRQLFYDKTNSNFEDTQPRFSKYRKFYKILNSETLLNFYIQDIYMSQLFCDNNNIPFNWTSWSYDFEKLYLDVFPEYLRSTYIPLNLTNYFPKNVKVQFARDGYHPGCAYHMALAERMYDFYKSNNLSIANTL